MSPDQSKPGNLETSIATVDEEKPGILASIRNAIGGVFAKFKTNDQKWKDVAAEDDNSNPEGAEVDEPQSNEIAVIEEEQEPLTTPSEVAEGIAGFILPGGLSRIVGRLLKSKEEKAREKRKEQAKNERLAARLREDRDEATQEVTGAISDLTDVVNEQRNALFDLLRSALGIEDKKEGPEKSPKSEEKMKALKAADTSDSDDTNDEKDDITTQADQSTLAENKKGKTADKPSTETRDDSAISKVGLETETDKPAEVPSLKPTSSDGKIKTEDESTVASTSEAEATMESESKDKPAATSITETKAKSEPAGIEVTRSEEPDELVKSGTRPEATVVNFPKTTEARSPDQVKNRRNSRSETSPVVTNTSTRPSTSARNDSSKGVVSLLERVNAAQDRKANEIEKAKSLGQGLAELRTHPAQEASEFILACLNECDLTDHDVEQSLTEPILTSITNHTDSKYVDYDEARRMTHHLYLSFQPLLKQLEDHPVPNHENFGSIVISSNLKDRFIDMCKYPDPEGFIDIFNRTLDQYLDRDDGLIDFYKDFFEMLVQLDLYTKNRNIEEEARWTA